MPVTPNTITHEAINTSLDIDLVERFSQEYDRLAEVLGIATVETVAAGTALNQLKITGQLNDSKTDDVVTKTDAGVVTGFIPGSSSGDNYVEGDLVALSKFMAEKVSVGEVIGKPYRKQTTAQAIQSSGYIPAVVRTDDKMVKDVRGKIINKFFAYLNKGTGTLPEGVAPTTLQEAIAYADAALEDTLEDNNDASSNLVHFVSRQDVAKHLAAAEITTQALFGMTYLKSFLGANNIFVTNKVAQGSVFVTPAENIRMFGIDFATLSQAGLPYNTDANGLIGVCHEPGYDRVSVYTNVLYGAELFAEVKDYIVKASIQTIPTV